MSRPAQTMETVFLRDYHNYLLDVFADFESASSSDTSSRLGPRLSNLYSTFESQCLNVAWPCTATSETDCWIFSQLTLLNRALNPISSELVEQEPGQLGLCSLQGRFYEPFDSDSVLEACLLAHWLLKQHCCITTVDVSNYDFVSNHTVLFCDCLSASRAVRRLVLSSYDFADEFGGELAAAVGNMPLLQQLELREVSLSVDSAGALGYSVGSRNALTHVDFCENDRRPDSCSAFLEGAKSLTNLQFLGISTPNLGLNASADVAEMLLRNPNLETVVLSRAQFDSDDLHVLAEGFGTAPLLRLRKLELSHCALHASALAVLADGLQHHKVLSCLRFVNCGLDCAKIRALARVLRETSRLRELYLDSNTIKDAGATTLATCLASSRNLEVLSLKSNPLTGRGIVTLLEALERNASNATLYLGHVKVNDTEALDVTRTLEAMSGGKRVQLTYGSAGYFHLGRLLGTNHYHVDEIDLQEDSHLTSDHLKEIFAGLQHDCSVTKLSVNTEKLDDGALNELAQSLAVNRTLKTLNISVAVRPEGLVTLFSGLGKNASISQLTVEAGKFDVEAARAFADALRENRTLNSFSKFRGDADTLRLLASGLAQNYTLLRLSIEPECIKSRLAFELEEIRRRNRALLNEAVRYALNNTTEKSSALAFERVCCSDAFLAHLASVKGMSDASARERLRNTRRFIASKYPVICGIVREKLECRRDDCGLVQLDSLSWECLEQIFSYLRVTDVVA